jgi:hypothetical protein
MKITIKTDKFTIGFKSISNRKFSKDWVTERFEYELKQSLKISLSDVIEKLNSDYSEFSFLLMSKPSEINKDGINMDIYLKISNDIAHQYFPVLTKFILKPSIFNSESDIILWRRFFSIADQYISDELYENDLYYDHDKGDYDIFDWCLKSFPLIKK